MNDDILVNNTDYQELKNDPVIQEEVNNIIELNSVSENEFIEEEKILSFNKLGVTRNENKSDTIILGSNDTINANNNEISNIDKLDYFNKTVLWTNSDVTQSFSGQYAILNDDWKNYDFIGIEFNGDTSHENHFVQIVSKEDFETGLPTNGASWAGNSLRFTTGYLTTTADIIYRNFTPSTSGDNYIYISDGKNFQNNIRNNGAIPVNIYGLNKKPLVSYDGVINNNYYQYYVSGNESSTSWNILNKPLNQYTVSESYQAMSLLMALFIGLYLIIRRCIYKWR